VDAARSLDSVSAVFLATESDMKPSR